MPTKIEIATRQRIHDEWPRFHVFWDATKSHVKSGRVLKESDVRAVLERLLSDVLGYEPDQIDREADYADFLILYQGMKLAVVETKDWGAFQSDATLESALRQAANYADRHRAKYLFACDGETLVLAEREDDQIYVKILVPIHDSEPADDVFYFTHYGLSKVPKAVQRTIEHSVETIDPKLYKSHHGTKLPYKSFAYIGDLRDKKTWKLPYLLEDGKTVDTGRIDKAVSYIWGQGGYRGAKSKGRLPEEALPDVAKKLARAYQQLGRWSKDDKSKAVQMLWQYLESRGETDLR
ncbi:hypothetical protein [Alicyclobacillus herbarius]|uniref:hypothetical protein n=1 Tax=Alicyclobacillus herbarius TaxID=122960 RepID=UPI00041B35EB|nr:hypothetical protein [Alicyclobacillus herbarius]